MRVFDGDAQYGDPYVYAVTVRYVDRTTVELMGALQAPKPSEWRAIVKAFLEAGVTNVTFRRADGTLHALEDDWTTRGRHK